MKRILVASALAAASGPAAAQVGLYIGGGTTGAGLGAAFTVAPRFDMRVEYTGGRATGEERVDGNDYRTRVDLSNGGVLGDFYVASRFHLSAGLYYSNNKVKIEGRPSSTGTYTFNGVTYSAAGAVVTGDTTLRDGVAPYLGIGWATRPSEGRGFGFRVALGVLYLDPRTRLTVAGISGPTLARDVAAEEDKINDRLGNRRVYPVANAFFQYTF